MENQDLFHQNIHQWSKKYPKIALRLQYLHNVSIKLVDLTSKFPNLEKNGFLLHDSNPIEEANLWFNQLNIENCSIICIYGVGLGYYYDALKTWLHDDNQRIVIFLEDDLEVLYCLFHQQKGYDLLHDPQVVLFYFNDLKDNDLFDELYWDCILSDIKFSSLKSYEKNKEIRSFELKHKIIHDASVKNALVDEYLKFGASFFVNFYPNMLLLAESYQGTKLFGKFQNIPAIICGAGPSLEKNWMQLKNLLNKGILFAGGSALNALTSKGILPHFGIGLDPNPTQQYRLSTNKAYEVPLFYRNRMNHEAFKLAHGPKLYIPGSGGYEVADWFDEQLGLLEEIPWIDEGHNVVNFGLELAKHLGCNPIIFIGVDLAFTDQQSYASGIIENTEMSGDDFLEKKDFDLIPILKNDIFGNPIYTLWKWMAESEWIAEFAKANPELTIINATEGGIGMSGISNMKFNEAAEKYLLRSYDVISRIHAEIVESHFENLSNEKMIEMMKKLHASLKRSLENLTILIHDKINYERKLIETKIIPSINQSGLAALAEIELEEEPAYEHIIGIFNLVYSRILNKEIQSVNDDSVKENYVNEIEKNKINLKRLYFMQDVAKVNLYLIENALEERAKELKENG